MSGRIFMKTCFSCLTMFFTMFTLLSCKSDKNVNDLYKFPATKDVRVQVNVNLFSNGSPGFPIDLANRNLALNAFMIDGDAEQVSIKVDGGDFLSDLPVTLTGPSLSFPATLRIPVTVVSGTTGYSVRFQLRDRNSALLDSPGTNLDALRGSIQAGTDPSANAVDLSLASTIAFKYLSVSGSLSSNSALVAYTNILALVESKQKIIEQGLDSSQLPAFATFVAAIKAGLDYQVLTDTSFQQKIADEVIKAAVNSPAALEAVAKNFASTLIAAASEVSASLSDVNSPIGKVFTAGFVDVASIPEPASFSNAVFAPSSVAFADNDSSVNLSGDIVIAAPLVQAGVAAYRIYFGGEGKSSTKTLIGEIVANAATVKLSLLNQVQPSDATRFWVYPIASGVQLDVPASIGIFNLGGVNKAPAAPTGLAATITEFQSTISWNPVSGATGYNIYWSTTQPVRQASNRIRNAVSGYVQKNLLPSTNYYYAVTAVKDGIESVLSNEASAVTGPAVTNDLSAPSNLVATAGTRKVGLRWTAAGGSPVGYLVVRRSNAAVTWKPVDGQTYTVGQSLDGIHTVGLISNQTVGDVTNLNAGTYYFAVFAVSASKKYSNPVAVSAIVVGGNWAWFSGMQAGVVTPPVYGQMGVAAASNNPGLRVNAAVCGSGSTMYLFGGLENNNYDFYADLWKFDGTNWTWISGTTTLNTTATYGTKGVASPSNNPGIRASASCVVDSKGQVWLFGGSNNSVMNPTPYFNDLWKFDGTNWTWVSGSNTTGALGVYGTQGTASAGNAPGARNSVGMVIDSKDQIWIGYGDGYDSVMKTNEPQNDLWRFDGTNWTWMAGKSVVSASTTAGVYGTKGVKAVANYPGSRSQPTMQIDRRDRIWLFGGDGYDVNNANGSLNDLWAFDGTAWAWISGGNVRDVPGVAGTQGVASASNVMPSRSSAQMWIDIDNNVWLFGGVGFAGTFLGGGNPLFHDMWKFDGTNWTFMSGNLIGDENSVYDAAAVFSAVALPGATANACAWVDNEGFFRMYGGNSFASSNYPELVQDSWKYNP
ncbi:MAG: hypothetical protein EOP07_08615 [Proteobacteria bacterium]|nr:MAG: hypothetical protein EOP07_08615 [Pseudomonadota bacterium]